jgi:uracil-DNA glycosylase
MGSILGRLIIVDDAPDTLISVGELCDNGYQVIFNEADVKITKERGTWLPPKNPGEPFTMIILHPSYLLRSRNDMDMLNTITDLLEIKRLDEEIYASYINSQAFLED